MKLPLALFFVFALCTSAFAQKAEVTISLNEAFFDAALDALFANGAPLEFSLADKRDPATRRSSDLPLKSAFVPAGTPGVSGSVGPCAETIKIQREVGGVRTAVRFRDGKIFAPLAFSGNYDPPFVGCVGFSGWAESVIDLEFDENGQRLVARARVLNVDLNGTGGIGGTVVARLVQGSIDKKINPIELFQLSKLTFALPVRGSSDLRLRATGVRHELQNGAINVVVSYEFGR